MGTKDRLKERRRAIRVRKVGELTRKGKAPQPNYLDFSKCYALPFHRQNFKAR
jgi:hypothetical protein